MRGRTAARRGASGHAARSERPPHKACSTVNTGMGVYAVKALLIMGLGRLGSLPGQPASGWSIEQETAPRGPSVKRDRGINDLAGELR